MYKREKPKGYKNARYRYIPAFYNTETDDLIAKSWFWDIILDVEMWMDINVFKVDYFPITVKVDDDES